MNTPTRIGSYAIGLVALFGAAAGVGNIVGSGGAASSDGHAQHTSGRQDIADMGASGAAADHLPGGLMISGHGYTLSLNDDQVSAGAATPVSFQVLGPVWVPAPAPTA